MATVLLLTAIAWFLSRDDDVVIATAWIATLVPGVVTLAIRAGSGSELPTMALLLGSRPRRADRPRPQGRPVRPQANPVPRRSRRAAWASPT